MSEPVSTGALSSGSVVRGGALDALRFVAALFVVVFHFGGEAPITLQSMHGFLARGYLATDFFLLLSGFVLAKAYGAGVASRKISFGRFWSKRFVRCYPTHLITLAILMLMVAVAAVLGIEPNNTHRFDWSGLPAQVLLLHAFGIGGEHWNVPSWTISTLLICYAAFPTLWRWFLWIERPFPALALGVLILLGSDLLSLALVGQHQFNLTFEYAFFRAAPLFLVGLCVARFVQTARLGGGQARSIGFGGATVLVVNALALGPDVINMLAIAAIVIGCGASPAGRSLPGAEWGAKMSFSLFMVHTITGAVWFGLAAPLMTRVMPEAAAGAWLGWSLWLGAVAFTLVGAGLYHHLIDEPIQRYLSRRLFGPVRPAAHPALRPATEPSA